MTRSSAAPRLAIRRVEPGDADALARLLANIDTSFFRPHPMTAAEAARLAGLDGRDVYVIGWEDGDPVAYGMLRGWDEGYEIAMLGIGVRRDRLRQGFGRAMMAELQEIARQIGAPCVRLRVHPDNEPALSLYRSLGYREDGMERGELVMVLDLPRD